jgi:hypothetical protein
VLRVWRDQEVKSALFRNVHTALACTGLAVPLAAHAQDMPDAPEIAAFEAAHFVARTRDFLELLRRQLPNDSEDLAGVHLFPMSPPSAESLQLLELEAGAFSPSLLNEALACGLPGNVPSDGEILVFEASVEGVTVPVFPIPDTHDLAYFELSVDRPGSPVLLVVHGREPFAIRIVSSSATDLIGVHTNTHYPSLVLGLPPNLVSQNYQTEVDREGCNYDSTGAFEWAGNRRITRIKARWTYGSPENLRQAIGNAQPVRRNWPRLAEFLDPDMPVPSQYGLAVLADRGYLRVHEDISGDQRYEIRKPFRLPEGLYGAHSAEFLVPPGVDLPSGDLGHSRIERVDSK